MKVLTNCLLRIFLLLFVFASTNCSKEDQVQPIQYLDTQDYESISKTVNASEIPDIMSFIESKSNGQLEFAISASNGHTEMMRNHEDDLVVTNVLQEQIQQVTNSYGKSSYSFRLIEQQDKQGIYFLNLVVKEYKENLYMYIANYVPNIEWLKSVDGEFTDLSSYTGMLYLYSDTGAYLGKVEFVNGASSSQSLRNPCPDGTNNEGGGSDGDGDNNGSGYNGDGSGTSGDGSTGGDGTSNGDGSNGDGGDSAGDGDIGDAGNGCVWQVITCPSCDDGSGLLLIICPDENTRTVNDHLREPCPGGSGSGSYNGNSTCYTPEGDPCPNGCNENNECYNQEDIENNEVPVNNPSIVDELNGLFDPDLSPEIVNWIEQSAENRQDAKRIRNYLLDNTDSNGTTSEEAQEFAQAAFNALMDGGEFDESSGIIYNKTITDYPCQKQLVEQANSTTGPFADLFQEIFNESDRGNLEYYAANLPLNLNAANTQQLSNGWIVTTMNKWRLENSTDLDIVKTTIHESIHAILLYIYQNPDNNFNDPNNPEPTYAQLVDMFNQHRENYGNTNQTQHDYMSSLIDQISDAIEVWADANGYENVPSDYFDKLAWGGLRDTDTFELLYPELIDGNPNNPNPAYQEIERIIYAEARLTPTDAANAIGVQASTLNCN